MSCPTMQGTGVGCGQGLQRLQQTQEQAVNSKPAGWTFYLIVAVIGSLLFWTMRHWL